MFFKAFLHLLYIEYGIAVVNFVIKIFTCPQSVGVVVYLESTVKLKCRSTVVNELLKMLKPRLITLCDIILIDMTCKVFVNNGSTF